MTGPEQHAATAREGAPSSERPDIDRLVETLVKYRKGSRQYDAAMYELVALAGRAGKWPEELHAQYLVVLDERDAAEARADELQRELARAAVENQSLRSALDGHEPSVWAERMAATVGASESLIRERERADELQRERDEARRESEWQMGSKLEAQTTLRAITEALDLRFDQLGIGWKEAAPKILARIETIVDEAERGFTERDQARREADQLRAKLERAYRYRESQEGLPTGTLGYPTRALAGVQAEEQTTDVVLDFDQGKVLTGDEAKGFTTEGIVGTVGSTPPVQADNKDSA